MAAAPRIVHIENPHGPTAELKNLIRMLEAGQKRNKPERAEDKAKIRIVGKPDPELLKPPPKSPRQVPGKKDPRFFDPKKDNELAGLGPNKEKPKPKSPREEIPNREKAMRDRKRQAQKDQGTLYPKLPPKEKPKSGDDKEKDDKKSNSKPITPRKPVLKLATKKPEPNSNGDRTQFEDDRQGWAGQHPDNQGPKPGTYKPPGSTKTKPIPPIPGTPKIPPTHKPILIVTTKKVPTKPPEDILVPKPGLTGGLRAVITKRK